jgi:predicted Rossmann-fold nucleotide-binding protein
MEKSSNKLVDLSVAFAVEILNLVKFLKSQHETIISNQIGSIGTFDELFDALAQKKLGAINCPIGVLNVDGFFDPLFELLKKSMDVGFTSERAFSMLKSGRTPGELLENMNKTVNGKGE